MKQVIFVGWISKGSIPVVGETVKNQYIIEELRKYCEVIELDFYQKNKHPWIYLQAIWAFMRYPHASIILSTSAKNVYAMLKLLKGLGVKRHIIHWVVGGAFPQLVKEGRFKADVFNYVSMNLVQCRDMIDQLKEAGVNNGKYVSNFKRIDYYPDFEQSLRLRSQEKVIRFVFLSRVHPAKGCDYIVYAVKSLNNSGYRDRFIVDFYGKFDESYQKEFLKSIENVENISYKGMLNLKEPKGYDVLSSYHAMLFPTFHPSEGFAGIFIDAFIAGLPVLASDWAYNAECIENGKTGIIFPTHDVAALKHTIKECIDGKIDLEVMAKNARAEASKYEAHNVLNKEYIKEIGLI
jgi:glycosyltransferase involved in cell wall biosynthesis